MTNNKMKDSFSNSLAITHSAKGNLPQISAFIKKTYFPIIFRVLKAYYLYQTQDLDQDLSQMKKELDSHSGDPYALDEINENIQEIETTLNFQKNRLKSFKYFEPSDVARLVNYDIHIQSLLSDSIGELIYFIESEDSADLKAFKEVFGIQGLRSILLQSKGHFDYLESLSGLCEGWVKAFAQNEGEKHQKSILGEVNLTKMIENSQRSLHSKIIAKKVNFINNFPSSEIVEAKVKESILQNEILINIYNNAIKYSHSGSKIETSITRDEGMTYIKITDFGDPISREKFDQLFLTTVTSTVGSHGELGSGVGLAYAKKELNEWGADIKFETDFESYKTVTLSFESVGIEDEDEFEEL